MLTNIIIFIRLIYAFIYYGFKIIILKLISQIKKIYLLINLIHKIFFIFFHLIIFLKFFFKYIYIYFLN